MSPPSRNLITSGYPVVATDPLADLRIENDRDPDSLRLEAFVRGDRMYEGHPVTQRDGRRAADIGGMDLDTEQIRAVRDWCDAWLQLYGERHTCEIPGGDQPYECLEAEDGRFWVGEETVVAVDFCPICGMKAPTPREPGVTTLTSRGSKP